MTFRGVVMVALLLLAVLTSPRAEAVSPAKQCRRLCKSAIAECVVAGQPRRVCKRQIHHACRREGPQVCGTIQCGGFAGSPCPGGSFCELPAGRCCCDFPGVCIADPCTLRCGAAETPVCGCDGATYGNDCERRCAGVSKAHDGSCP